MSENLSTKVKLYTNRSYLANDTASIPMLYPFWGSSSEDKRLPESGRYDHYEATGKQYFELTSLQDADIAVAPAAWESSSENKRLTEKLVETARQAGKKTAIFFWSDSAEAVPLDDIILFRTSFYKSQCKFYEFAQPSWSEDFVEKYFDDALPILEKTERPIVGFCGFAFLPNAQRQFSSALLNTAKKILKGASSDNQVGARLRGKALQALSSHKEIQTNFIIRNQFLGGAFLPNGSIDIQRMQEVRREYVQNIRESQYVLCVRGAGNFSYRLYETLCCGRIPIFIDTDCPLPYDFAVDWKQYCVWVNETDTHAIAEKLLDFHRKISPQDFVDLQRECRNFWKAWLSPEGFFEHFHLHLQRLSS